MRAVTALSQFVAFAAILAGAVPAWAGASFDIVVEAPGYSYKGKVLLEEKRLRIDISEGNHPLFNGNISIISREAGTEVLVIDHASKTYFQRQVGHIGGPLPASRGLGKTRALNTSVDKSRERLTDAGPVTERHTITARYDLDMEVMGEKLDAKVTMEAQFDIDPTIDQYAHPWGLQFAAKTGFQRLDNALARAIPNRLPLRQVVTFSRQIAGGPVISETMTILVTNVSQEDIADNLFYAPDGYPYQEPVF
ncbi:MAG TPA: hypothetical protein VFT12_02155, partial [Thermoanaerobaculia bacterium]|nr:hypothetical protein [Thermoanaerobaculia bacterium]